MLSREALQFLREGGDQPYFLLISTLAPHTANAAPPIPALRHQGAFSGVPFPVTPAVDEEDVSDKPAVIQGLDRYSRGEKSRAVRDWRLRMETLLAVDELVDSIVAFVDQSDAWRNTYLFYTSDNGYHIGEHRRKLARTMAIL